MVFDDTLMYTVNQKCNFFTFFIDKKKTKKKPPPNIIKSKYINNISELRNFCFYLINNKLELSANSPRSQL